MGHGKSEAAQLFYKYLVKEGVYSQEASPFVQSFNPETTTEKIFGGTNIKEFTEKGLIVYNYHYSFMVHKFVIIEEILDCTSSGLMVFKDTLTSGYHRDGAQSHPVMCDIIIGCTNLEPEEFAENNATQAFLERFTYQMEVKWSSYMEDDYVKAFEISEKRSPSFIVRAVANAAASTHDPQKGIRPVSPRTFMRAVKSCENCKENPLQPLYYMNYPGGFDHSAVKKAAVNLKELMKDQEDAEKLEKLREELNTIAQDFAKGFKQYTETPEDSNLAMTLYNDLKGIYNIFVELGMLKVRDTTTLKHKELLTTTKQGLRKMAETLQSAIPPDSPNVILSKFKNTPIENHEW